MDHVRGLIVGLLRAAFLAEVSVAWFPFASRELSLECPGTLIIAKAAGRSMASNKFWTQEPF